MHVRDSIRRIIVGIYLWPLSAAVKPIKYGIIDVSVKEFIYVWMYYPQVSITQINFINTYSLKIIFKSPNLFDKYLI